MSDIKTISVIGLGYIGLPTSAVIASCGVKVIGVDVNAKTVEIINSGKIHIVEPGLEEAVLASVKSGNLRAVNKPEASDAFMIAVPTPFKGSNHVPDLSYVKSAALSIAPVLKKGDLVILESTCPVGTTQQMAEWLATARKDLKFPGDVNIAYCPERVLPGKIIEELTKNDRVIGGMTPACAERAKKLYQLFVKGECVLTDSATAEMCKLTENSFRDVNIAFANELSMICDKFGINVWELIRLANRHPRVNILQPGPGVGGHCIAVDPWFIVDSAPREARLIRTAREVNDYKPHAVIDQIIDAANRFKNPTIACFGLAFKPNVDDLRESPALEITKHMAERKIGTVLAVEPHVTTLPKGLESVSLVSAEEAVKRADIIVILVDHQSFFGIDWKSAKQPIIDTRGVLSNPAVANTKLKAC
jgi:UDP-N-acetyl-D-mannosaminuronic acid dehydrogenase